MLNTKDGSLTPRVSDSQLTHLKTVRNSRSRLECSTTELSTGLSTSDLTNTDLESETLTLVTTSSGSSSTPELTPSEPGLTETRLSPIRLTNDSIVELLPMSDNGEMRSIRELDGTEDQERTLEMLEECASGSMETVTPITDTLPGGTATTISVKLGTSIKRETDTHLNQSETVLSSKLSQEWLDTEQSSGLSILVVTNTD